MQFSFKSFQFFFWFLVLILNSKIFGQDQKLKLEDIYSKNTFAINLPSQPQWASKPNTCYQLENKSDGFEIFITDFKTEKKLKTLFSSAKMKFTGDSLPKNIKHFEVSEDEKTILVQTNSQSIYRYSSKAKYYVANLLKKHVFALSSREEISYPTFSPDFSQIAYIKNNNLYVTNLITEKETKLTKDGKKNEIINGSADWVYEEEFELTKAFEWSDNSKKIAFLSFDETEVKEYQLQKWGIENYPIIESYKYPKAGEKNAKISIKIADIASEKIEILADYTNKDIYIPRIGWTKKQNILSFELLNRSQDSLQILHIDIRNKEIQKVKTLVSDAYVEINTLPFYLNDSSSFVYTDEQDGFRHIYNYNFELKKTTQLTQGNWEVEDIVGIDELKKLIYFTSKEFSVLEKHLYVIGFDGQNKRKLTSGTGSHEISFDPNVSTYIDFLSNDDGITAQWVESVNNRTIKVLENNEAFSKAKNPFNFGKISYFDFKNKDGISQNAWILKPSNFDSTKKYPVLQYVYGGPGSQNVAIKWKRKEFLWFQYLAQNGYIVACTDNRGTNGRGTAFRNCTLKNLGKIETEDQIDFAQHLGKLPYVDKSRIGIFGWSYGGFLSSMCLLVGNEIFNMAISVAPVSSWRFYDSIYTERYMKNPQDNAKGYDENSTLFHASKLKGKLLLIHGTGDDNVHIQHTIALQQALIDHNKPFDVFYYPDKNHGISGGNTRLHLFQMMSDYIFRNL